MKLPAHILFYVFLAFTTLALASPCQAQHRGSTKQHNSTPQQALDKRQDAFQGDKARGVHASYQWELSGPNEGDWWLIVNDGTYTIGRGKIHHPSVTFAASDEDWVAMSNKTLQRLVSIADWPLKDSRQLSVGKRIRQDFSLKLGMICSSAAGRTNSPKNTNLDTSEVEWEDK